MAEDDALHAIAGGDREMGGAGDAELVGDDDEAVPAAPVDLLQAASRVASEPRSATAGSSPTPGAS